MIEQELEALRMTLNQLEYQETKEDTSPDKYYGTIDLKIMPQYEEEKVMLKVVGMDHTFYAKRVPLVKVAIQIPLTYPSYEPPNLKIKGFYSKYVPKIQENLINNRW